MEELARAHSPRCSETTATASLQALRILHFWPQKSFYLPQYSKITAAQCAAHFATVQKLRTTALHSSTKAMARAISFDHPGQLTWFYQ
jgi:hypothetical protein